MQGQDDTPGHQDDDSPTDAGVPLPLPNDLLPPADQLPSAPNPRLGVSRRDYSPTERAGLKWLAVRDGVLTTSRAYGVPTTTLDGWLSADGGLGQVRGFLEEITLSDYLRAERAIYEAVVARAPSLSVDDLMLTFRKLVESRTGLAVTAAGQPALAAAQATVTLKVIEKDGEVQVIDLGPAPEASDQG